MKRYCYDCEKVILLTEDGYCTECGTHADRMKRIDEIGESIKDKPIDVMKYIDSQTHVPEDGDVRKATVPAPAVSMAIIMIADNAKKTHVHTYTLEEIAKYIKSKDSYGDIFHYLSHENIIKANQKEVEDE